MAKVNDQLHIHLIENNDSQVKEVESTPTTVQSYLQNSAYNTPKLVNIKQMLSNCHSLEALSNLSRKSRSPYSNSSRISLVPVTFDSAFKTNIIQSLSHQEKGVNEMKFLKKHLSSCTFFKNYALPMGDDVLESCISKIKIQYSSSQQFLISKGDQITKLFILLCGSATKTKQIIKKSEEILLSQNEIPIQNKASQFSQNLLQAPTFYNLNQQYQSPTSSNSEQTKINPISSILDGQFISSSESSYYIQNNEDSVYGYITTQDYMDSISNSKNRELITQLNGLRQSYFFSDWPVQKLKPIISQSSILSFSRNQYVYKQDDPSTFWYLVLDGEFEYTKEIVIENEINDIMKACLDTVSHTFKKQSLVTDENQKGRSEIRLSILQQGEIFGIEELLPNKQNRLYGVKCISCTGQIRQINEQYINKLAAKNNDEGKKLILLAQQKQNWLDRATTDKMQLNKQMHNTILNSKRNRTIQMIKAKEEEKEQDIIIHQIQRHNIKSRYNHESIKMEARTPNRGSMIIGHTQTFQSGSFDHTQRDASDLNGTLNKISDSSNYQNNEQIQTKYTFTQQYLPKSVRSHQKNSASLDLHSFNKNEPNPNDLYRNQIIIKTPLHLMQPDKTVQFLKVLPEIDGNSQIKKQLSQERKLMKIAKDDLLNQYRVTIDKYFSETNTKFYKKVQIKKCGVDKYLSPRISSMDQSVLSKTIKVENEEIKSPTLTHSIRQNAQKPQKVMIQKQEEQKEIEHLIQPIKKQGKVVIGEYSSLKSPINILSQNLMQPQEKSHSIYYASMNKNTQHDDSISKQSPSPMITLPRRLILPSNTKKILLNQLNTPSQSFLEKYSMNTTQSSSFKKDNKRLEKILSSRNNLATPNSSRSKLQNEYTFSQASMFQANVSPQKYNHNILLKEIKLKSNDMHQIQSNSNN